MDLIRRCMAEAIGTFLLVFFGAGSAAVTLMIATGTESKTPFNIGIGALGGLGDWLAIGLAFGFTITAVIYGMGRISGAHINPAVTIALWVTKRLPARDMGAYIVAQLVGACAGSFLFAAAAGMDAVTIGGLGATAPFPGISPWQAMLAEGIGTFILMLAIMGAAVDRKAPPGFAGLVIGLTVAGVIVTLGNISGASLNPARTFGPYMGDMLLAGSNLWAHFPIYVIGPLAGAISAALVWDWMTRE